MPIQMFESHEVVYYFKHVLRLGMLKSFFKINYWLQKNHFLLSL